MIDYSIALTSWKLDAAPLTALRHEVFVDEQLVPIDMEIDDMDFQAAHFKACLKDGEVIATARLLPNQYVGRMCVKKAFRSQGVGGDMLQFIIQHARDEKVPALYLNAQLSAQAFYQKFGFREDSDIFMEAGIPHIRMTLALPS